jgi:phytoene dehydrogenase-like protein
MKRPLFTILFVVTHVVAFPSPCHRTSRTKFNIVQSKQPEWDEDSYDVIVIGAGVGGLSCAALTAKYGMKTLCVEAHDTPGGVAHSFQRYSSASNTTPFCFDSGPSLVSGLSQQGTNPLRQVLDAIGTSDAVQWKTYDGWIVHDTSDDTSFKITTGSSGAFERAIETKAGINARREFIEFKTKLLESGGLSESSAYIPPFALRGDIQAVASLFPYYFKLLSIGGKGQLLTGPFSNVMDLYGVKDPFLRKWFDYLSFALSGLDASQTQAAAVAYMMIDLHKEGAVLDYPMGGMDSLIQALVLGMQNHGGQLQLNSRVERILLSQEGSMACAEGVVLENGRVIKAKKGVVCNAPLWNMARILEDSIDGYHGEGVVKDAVSMIRNEADSMCMTRSFMHLHLGIPKDGLPALECHHSVLDLTDAVDAEQNMVIIRYVS